MSERSEQPPAIVQTPPGLADSGPSIATPAGLEAAGGRFISRGRLTVRAIYWVAWIAVTRQGSLAVGFLREIEALGLGAVRLVASAGVLVGLIAIFQVAYQLNPLGAEMLSPRAVGWFAARELAPVVAGLLVVARSSSAIAGELDAILAAERATAPGGQLRAGRGELRRLAAWRRLVHATIVVDLPEKGLTTVQLDRGTVSAVSADSLSIAEAGGTSVTITLGAETRVRKDGKKAAVADLKVGDEVFAMSLVEGSSSEAYLVVVPRPRD